MNMSDTAAIHYSYTTYSYLLAIPINIVNIISRLEAILRGK